MHGDYQFANVMYRHGGPARLAAIVDWEMGTVGDPKLDLGWVVQSWPEDTSGGDGTVGGYVDMTGMPSKAQVLARYAEVSGRQVDDIDYYVVLAKWKLGRRARAGLPAAPATTSSSRPSGRWCSTSCATPASWPPPPTTRVTPTGGG